MLCYPLSRRAGQSGSIIYRPFGVSPESGLCPSLGGFPTFPKIGTRHHHWHGTRIRTSNRRAFGKNGLDCPRFTVVQLWGGAVARFNPFKRLIGSLLCPVTVTRPSSSFSPKIPFAIALPPALPETLFVARPPLVHLDGPSTILALTPVRRQAFPLLTHRLPFTISGLLSCPILIKSNASGQATLHDLLFTITPFSSFSLQYDTYSVNAKPVAMPSFWSVHHPNIRACSRMTLHCVLQPLVAPRRSIAKRKSLEMRFGQGLTAARREKRRQTNAKSVLHRAYGHARLLVRSLCDQ